MRFLYEIATLFKRAIFIIILILFIGENNVLLKYFQICKVNYQKKLLFTANLAIPNSVIFWLKLLKIANYEMNNLCIKIN